MFFGPDFITVSKACIKCTCTPYLSDFIPMKYECRGNMRSFMSFQTDEEVEWTDIKRHALEAIAKFFESGDPITTGAVHHESSESGYFGHLEIMWLLHFILCYNLNTVCFLYARSL